MALLRCDFQSDVLGVSTSMTVVMPPVTHRPPPVLYLLHGLGDDDTAWTRRTSVERYAEERGLAVVMPQAQRSFYTDEALGRPYWTFVSEELPAVVGGLLRVTDRPAETFVAGLSMGGYGALKLALCHPGRFGAAASLSGALDLAGRVRDLTPDRIHPGDPHIWRRVFCDDPIEGGPADLFHLLPSVRNPPPLFVWCGTEDPLYAGNVRFRDACLRHDVPVTASFTAGAHDWSSWDAKIQEVLTWLPLPLPG